MTDKSGIFHLGHAKDYKQKADAYRKKAGAYIELENDPLWSVFDKIVRLFNELRSKNHIRAKQLDEMIPKQDKVALAYLYFIPKPHKVIFGRFLSRYSCLFSLFFIGRNAIKVHCLSDEYTNNWYFLILRQITSTII